MKKSKWYITDNGDIGYKMGNFFGVTTGGDIDLRLSDHMHVSSSDGLGFNTRWENEDEEESDEYW